MNIDDSAPVALDPPDDILAIALRADGMEDGDIAQLLDALRVPLPPSTAPAGFPIAGVTDPAVFAFDLASLSPVVDDVPLSPPPATEGPARPAAPSPALFDTLQKAPDPSIDYLSRFGIGPSSPSALAVDLRGQIRRMIRGL